MCNIRWIQFKERRESAQKGEEREKKGKWTESRREAEREQFNAVIKFLIAPWEMCFGIAPGQLSIAPRLFTPQSMLSHMLSVSLSLSGTHTHTIWTNRNLIRASSLCSRANSESPNMCQLHQMMHRQEETQRRSRLAREKAVRNHHLQSLSCRSHSHIVAHTRQLPWQVHTNHPYESTNGNLFPKIFFSFP